jgi:hypothetical protein
MLDTDRNKLFHIYLQKTERSLYKTLRHLNEHYSKSSFILLSINLELIEL